METTHLISQEWDSLSGQYAAEEADFMTQFLGGNTNYSCFPSNVANANSMCFSQGSSTNNANSGIYFSDQATNIDSLSGLFMQERRERINERLRMLQTLVPNGTKVDISTMLEEVVQYVKFLHLLIKVLSSDDMWMYAPLAYNGINIGLDLTFSSPTN